MYKSQQSDLDLRPCDLKREQLLSRGIHCTMFGNFQTKGSKDIAMIRHHLVTGLQNNQLTTKRQVQNKLTLMKGYIPETHYQKDNISDHDGVNGITFNYNLYDIYFHVFNGLYNFTMFFAEHVKKKYCIKQRNFAS